MSLVDRILSYQGHPPVMYPSNMDFKDKAIFDGYIRSSIPAMEIKRLENIHSTTDCILYKNGLPLREGSPYYFEKDHPVAKRDSAISLRTLKRLIRYYIINPQTTVQEPAAWIIDTYSSAYYHWIAETLPRLFLLDLVDNENRAVLLPKRFLNHAYIKDSLDLFPHRNFIFMEDHQLYKVKNTLFISPMGMPYQFNQPLLKAYREYMLSKLSLTTSSDNSVGKKIYISRAKSLYRKILNENEVKTLLSDAGFESVYMEDLSLYDQIKLSHQSSVIAGIHGAGLSNMVFSKEQATVLELQKYMEWPSCFYRLANALELKYDYLFCEHFPKEETSELTADLKVDLSSLEKIVNSL